MVRIACGMTQREVAIRAGVRQQRVSDLELDRLASVSWAILERVAEALDVALYMDARWRHGDVDRLIDSVHASIVESVARELRRSGWEVTLEYSFNFYGERGSVDILAWTPATRTLLIVEVKSRLTDLQDLFATMAKKVRIVPGLLKTERGWDAVSVSRLLVMPGSTANRTVVERHEASFRATFPERGPAIRRWLKTPTGSIAGVWFISPTRVASTKPLIRVRKARSSRRCHGRAAVPSVDPLV